MGLLKRGKEKKEAEVVKETRTVKIQGRQAERLAALQQRTLRLKDQQAKIIIELEKIRGGTEAILGLNADKDEAVVSYNFDTCEATLEKIPSKKGEK